MSAALAIDNPYRAPYATRLDRGERFKRSGARINESGRGARSGLNFNC